MIDGCREGIDDRETDILGGSGWQGERDKEVWVTRRER